MECDVSAVALDYCFGEVESESVASCLVDVAVGDSVVFFEYVFLVCGGYSYSVVGYGYVCVVVVVGECVELYFVWWVAVFDGVVDEGGYDACDEFYVEAGVELWVGLYLYLALSVEPQLCFSCYVCEHFMEVGF